VRRTRVAVRRPLIDAERDLLAFLTIRTISSQLGCTDELAAEALDDMAGRGEVFYRGNFFDAYVTVRGRDLVHCTREWLSFMATAAEDGDAPPTYGTPIDG
jgi:hypothetical protein